MSASSPEPENQTPSLSGLLSTYLTRAAWGLIDRVLRAGSGAVLNDGRAGPAPPDLSEELHRTAKELRSKAIDDEGRRVDYRQIKESRAFQRLQELADSLSAYSLADLGQGPDLTAFWINLYNTLVLDAIIRFSITGNVGPRLFRRAAYRIDGLRFCLDDIEHGVLRGNRRHPLFRIRSFGPLDKRRSASLPGLDPRLHFALVCGARSCPPIRVYRGADLDKQLDTAAVNFINGDWVELERDRSSLHISPIFQWYEADFEEIGGVRATIARYAADEGVKSAARDVSVNITYQTYDWSVNSFL